MYDYMKSKKNSVTATVHEVTDIRFTTYTDISVSKPFLTVTSMSARNVCAFEDPEDHREPFYKSLSLSSNSPREH